jgi:hypothetical protein
LKLLISQKNWDIFSSSQVVFSEYMNFKVIIKGKLLICNDSLVILKVFIKEGLISEGIFNLSASQALSSKTFSKIFIPNFFTFGWKVKDGDFVHF